MLCSCYFDRASILAVGGDADIFPNYTNGGQVFTLRSRSHHVGICVQPPAPPHRGLKIEMHCSVKLYFEVHKFRGLKIYICAPLAKRQYFIVSLKGHVVKLRVRLLVMTTPSCRDFAGNAIQTGTSEIVCPRPSHSSKPRAHRRSSLHWSD